MKLSVILIGFAIITKSHASCDSHRVTNVSDVKEKSADTVIKEIPKDRNGNPRSYYRNKPQVEKLLGLSSIENGFDSLQIRLWYGYAFNDSSQLAVLTNSKGKWSGQFFTLVYHLSELGDSIKSITQKAEFREPKSGWTELKQKLLQLKVLSLPDYHTIPEYDQVADGDAVIVEVSSKKVYRIYSYQEPRMFQNKFWQAANMERILELIEKEFGFKPLREL
jgi:hypothetical protein